MIITYDFCMIHQEREPDQPGDYRACGECFHVFRTAAELVETFNAVMQQDQEDAIKNGWTPVAFEPVDDAEQIHFCPLCTHDF